MNVRALIGLLGAVAVGVVVGLATTSWSGPWLYAAAAATVVVVAASASRSSTGLMSPGADTHCGARPYGAVDPRG